jgi:hypothetical protein
MLRRIALWRSIAIRSAVGIAVLACVAASHAATNFEVSPTQAALDDPEATLQLLASTKGTDGRQVDVTRKATYRSEDETVAVVDELGLVQPIGDGETNVVVTFDGTEMKVPVEVVDVDKPHPISFPRDIVPILTKTACNMGGCHGKAEGQNGFKLSVFGFDTRADHAAIAMEGRSRRIARSAPEMSLLLRKATATEPHGGGQRMTSDSLRYRRLRRWIEEGAEYITDNAPQVVRIEVEPSEQVLLGGENRQLRVWAIDEAGVRRCVTTEAEYESNAGTIAGVDGRGFVQASQIPGEAGILARYLGFVTVCRVTIPRPGVQFTRPPEVNFIDQLAWDKLQRLGIEPSPLCDDATFFRRAYLDVIGTLPTADEARAFLADKSADKRAKLVDRLLERPEYVNYWTMRFSDILRVDQTKISPAGSVAFTRWLKRQFRENRPYDQMVRDLLTAKGNVKAEGPAAYFNAVDTPELMARYVSQAFLGVRIECAQCHHHPADRWGQDDYFAMANLFSGVTKKKIGTNIGAATDYAIVPGAPKDAKHPRTGEVVAAKALGAEPVSFQPYDDRRVYLVNWMTAESNPFFSTMIANRLWAHYFGRGLVEQIDDLRMTNPASNEPLLKSLAAHMREVKYDLKAFTRTMMNSRLYQLSSATLPSNADDAQNFSHAAHKAVPAEVLLDALVQATGTSEEYEGWPSGTRAIEIWDNKLPSYFFRIFGRPVRSSVCECERSNEPSIAQALHMMNSPEVGAKVQAHDGLAARLALSDRSTDAIIDELFLSTITRFPTDEERAAVRTTFPTTAEAKPADRRRATEDLLWALVNSKEFIYNH